MKTQCAVLIIAFLAQTPAIAQDAVVAAPDTPDQTPVDACAEYGPGYVKLPNSQTCVRISGKVRVDIETGSGAQKPKH